MSDNLTVTKYTCYCCNGEGVTRDWTHQDPCLECQATGKVTEEQIRSHEQAIDRLRDKLTAEHTEWRRAVRETREPMKEDDNDLPF